MTKSRLRLAFLAIAGVWATLLIVVSVISALSTHHGTTPATTPAPLAIGTQLQRPRPLPAITLLDASGRPVPLSSWRGKWVVVAPSLTLCNEVCPMTTGTLIELKAALARAGLAQRVQVAEVSVDPWRDTPARLRAYRRMTGADFSLLTGSQQQLHELWHFLGIFYQRVSQANPPGVDWMTHRPEIIDVIHADGFFIIDPAGQERIENVGMPTVTGTLSASLRRLLGDKGLANLAHPELPWTANQVLGDLYHLMNKQLPSSSETSPQPPTAAQLQAQLAGSPAALASLHAQDGQMLGPYSALTARLRSLRGYPVVLNAWAQWCTACKSEFGLLAAASAHYGRRVGFLAVDTNDDPGKARAFLADHPVGYPSYESSGSDLSPLAIIEGLPDTVFIGAGGKVVHIHIGAYEGAAALRNDIEHYALGVKG